MQTLRVFARMGPLLLALISTQTPTCETVHTPFADKRRQSMASIKRRKRSGFGANRVSFIRGHKHSGLDLRGRYKEPVFAICAGRVFDIHLGFPHRTVVVEHRNENGERFFSSYKHIEDILVKEGDLVTAQTRLGRLFDRKERKRARFDQHLHFEIRKTMDDGGEASWSSMSMKALLRVFKDPERFFKRSLGRGSL